MIFKRNKSIKKQAAKALAVKERDESSLSLFYKTKEKIKLSTTTVIKTKNSYTTKKIPIKKVLAILTILIVIIGSFILVPPIINGTALLNWIKLLGQFFNFRDVTVEGGVAKTITQTFEAAYKGIFESLIMTTVGMTIGVALSIPTALIASKNVNQHPSINVLMKTIVTISRALPIVMLAQIISLPFGRYSDFAGTITLTLFVWSTFTKWLYEDIEDISNETLESMRVSGLSNNQLLKNVVLPEVSQKTVASGFYMFEITFRFTAALGLFGFGGIGFVMKTYNFTNPSHWGHLLVIMSLFVMTVMLLNILSTVVQKYIVNYKTKRTLFGNKEKDIQFKEMINSKKIIIKQKEELTFMTSSRKPKMHKYVISLILILLISLTIWKLSTTDYTITIVGKDRFNYAIENIFKPDWSILKSPKNVNPLFLLVDALGIIIGTFVLAVLLSFPLGILSTKRMVGKATSSIFKGINGFLRAMPSFAFVAFTLFFAPNDKGAFAAILGMGISSAGNLGERLRLLIESLPESQGKTMQVTGGTKWDQLRNGIIPQVLPAFIGRAVYTLELSLKNILVLAPFGISAFAVSFNNSMTWEQGLPPQYHIASVFFVLFMVSILVIEFATQWCRKKLVAPTKLQSRNFIMKRFVLDLNVNINILTNKYIYAPMKKFNKVKELEIQNFQLFKIIEKLDFASELYNKYSTEWIIDEKGDN